MLILLVEDNADHAELIMRALPGIRVLHFGDGDAVTNYLFPDVSDNVHLELPKLILLDLRLPGMDGLEVLRKVKASEKLCTIPVVVLTSSGAVNDITSAYQVLANSYLVKPVDYDQFKMLLANIAKYWLELNVLPPI